MQWVGLTVTMREAVMRARHNYTRSFRPSQLPIGEGALHEALRLDALQERLDEREGESHEEDRQKDCGQEGR